ncbi:ubiquitin-60S ribosomal protein L40-1, partial [Tanacetum coccineum]
MDFHAKTFPGRDGVGCYARLHPRAVNCMKKKCGHSNQNYDSGLLDKDENEVEVEADQEEIDVEAEANQVENDVEVKTNMDENDPEAETYKEEIEVETNVDKE